MKSIFLILFTLPALLIFSQEDEMPTDKMPVTRNVAASSQDRLVLDFTFDNWANDIDELETKWYSRGFGVSFMYDIQIKESKFSFAPGLGVTSNSVFINGIMTDTGKTYIDYASFDEVSTKKSKFNTVYLEIPVELRFRSNQDNPARSFKFGIGFKAGLKIDAKSKVKEDLGDQTKVYKEKRWNDVQTFRVGPTLRMGYGPVNVVAFFSLMDVFKKDEGPVLTPFSVGISLNGL